MEWVLWRHIVKPWRLSVILWHVHIRKYRIDDIFKLGNPEYYRKKKKIISLARLQAEIGTACLMTSWRHFVTLFHHANTMTITKLSSATKEITETKIESALEHICRLRWRQFVSWRLVVIFVSACRGKPTELNDINKILLWKCQVMTPWGHDVMISRK